MRPELNPDFALQSRLSFGRGARYAWALSAAAVLFTLEEAVIGGAPGATSMRAGALLLLGALPYGAIQVRTLERKGQMETRRLTAGSPGSLALALLTGSSWALLLAGALLLAAGAAAGHALPPFTLAALVALSIAMTLVLLLMPASYQLDSWVLLLLLGVAVFGIVESMRGDRKVAIGLLIVSLVIVPWALPMALRRMRGAIPKFAGTPVSVMRLVVRLRATRHAEFARGLVSAGQSFSAAPAVAIGGMWLIWWLTRNREPTARDIFEVLVVYGPLLLAAYDTAGRVAHEHSSESLDRIRLTGQPPWKVAIETALAFSMPFVGVSLVCAAALAILDPINAPGILAPWPVVAGCLVFWPLPGVLRGGKPILMVACAIAVALPTARVRSHFLGAVAVATAVLVTAATLDARAGHYGWRVAAGTAGLAAVVAAVVDRHVGLVLIAGLMSVGAALLFPARGRIPPRTIAACAAVATLAGALGGWLGGLRFALQPLVVNTARGPVYFDGFGSPKAGALIAGLYAAAGFAYGCYALNRFATRTRAGLVLRAVPLTAGILYVLGQRLLDGANESFMERYRLSGFGLLQLLLLALLTAATLFMAWRDHRSVRATPPPS